MPKQVCFEDEVEAYRSDFGSGAASRSLEIATSSNVDLTLPWLHSVRFEYNYLNPYDAVLHAMATRFQVCFPDLDTSQLHDMVNPAVSQCRLLDEHLTNCAIDEDIREAEPEDFGLQELPVLLDEEEDVRLLIEGLATQEDGSITIEMFGLIVTHHSVRTASSAPDVESIKETVRQTWQDVTPRGSITNAHPLRPQDSISDNVIQFLVEILPPEIRVPPIDVPVLRRSKWYSDDSVSVETAYMRDSQTGYELLIDAGHAEWCFSSRDIQCNLHIEGRIAFLSLRHPLRAGAVLSFFIHDDWVDPGAKDHDNTLVTSDEMSMIDLSGHFGKAVVSMEGNSASGTPSLLHQSIAVKHYVPIPIPPFEVVMEKGGLEGNSASGTPGPTTCVRESKPNPGIAPDLDGVVPHRQRTADGQVIIGRTIAPPNWQTNRAYRHAAESGSLFRDDADDLRVRIRSWIASVRTQLILPHRDFTIRAQLMGDLEAKIRRAWRDQIQQTDSIKLTVVRPSPNIGYTGRRPLHVLVELNRPYNSQLHPILLAHREITARGPASHIQWIPVLVATPIGRTTLHNICAPPCRSDQLLVPMPGRVRRWMSSENGRPIYSGLFLPIWWDARIQPPPNPAYEQDDQQVLIQTTLTPTTSVRQSAVISPPTASPTSHVFDRWCRLEERTGQIRDTQSSDDIWMMQITDSPLSHELCCQHSLVQRFRELTANTEGLQICSHGLSGITVGSRYFMIPEANILLLKQAVRMNWPEFQDASGMLHLVHPQPQDTLRSSWRTCVHIVVEFVTDAIVRPLDVAPALEESVVWNAYGNANIKHEASYFAKRLHFSDISVKFDHLCVRASFRCIVRVEGYRLHPDEVADVADGTFVQLHALPQVSAPPQEFANYLWHGQQFLEATANLLGYWTMPTITWSFHLIDAEGYQGQRDYHPSNSEFQSSDQVVTVMYHLWQEQTPDALAFTGLIHYGASATLHFLGFPPDSDLSPGLVWRDVNRAPVLSALWLPRAATVSDFCQALVIEGSLLDHTSMAVVVDGIEYLSHDRFRPRVGALYMLRPALPSDEDETSMLQCHSSVHDPTSIDIPVDPDEVDFMQNAVESITPSDRTQGQFVVHIFARKTWHKAFDTESTEDLQAQIVDQWNLPTSGDMSVVALHPINYPPHWVADGDTVAFIVELAGEMRCTGQTWTTSWW